MARFRTRYAGAALLFLVTQAAWPQESPKKLSLVEAIRLARNNSPLLGAARADLAASNSIARAARAGAGPQLSANGFASTGSNSGILGSSPMVEPPVWVLIPTGGYLDANLALMIPLFAPRIQAMASSATFQARAAMGDLDETAGDLELQVTEAFNRALREREIVLAEESAVKAADELVRTTQAQFDTGKGIEAEVQRSQAELFRAKRALTSAHNEETKAILDLAAAMNVDLAKPPAPDGSLASVSRESDLNSLVVKAKAKRGLILAAKARLEAAAKDLHAADGQRQPQLYGGVMEDATNRSDMGGLSAGITLSLPLFDGGKISAEVAQARSQVARAKANLKLAEIAVEREVRQAWLDLSTAKANSASAEVSVRAAQSAYDVTALRVAAGKSILIEQLDALDALTQAKADLARSQFDETLADAKLARATGGHL